MKYIKKRIEVEAEQWFPGKEVGGVTVLEVGSYESSNRAHVLTPNGLVPIEPGEWVITGAAGEKYPCKAHIFEQTYEPVRQELEPRGGWDALAEAAARAEAAEAKVAELMRHLDDSFKVSDSIDDRAEAAEKTLQLACEVVEAAVDGNPKVVPEELPRWLAVYLGTAREIDAERGAVVRALTIELQAARARLGEEVTVVMTTAATTAEVPSQQVSWPRPFADVVVEEFEADPKESIEQLDAYVTAKYGFQGTEPGQAVVAATDEVVTMCKMTFYGLPCTLREGHEGACTPDDSWRPRSPT